MDSENSAEPFSSPRVDNDRTSAVRRVLVVDDTKASASVLSKLLEIMGQVVITAHDGATALQQAQLMPPDLVISDIAMPDIDGYELARRLRQQPGMDRAVLAALTGYGQESDRRQAKEAGFDFHLVKPVSLEALEELLASCATVPADQALPRTAKAGR